jgi:hypothetical protein
LLATGQQSDQQSERRLDDHGNEGGDSQVSKLTRVLLPLISVAIACLAIGLGVLLFVVWRARHNPKTEVIRHIPPIDEPSLYEDIPPNDTVTTTHDVSAGTASGGGGGVGDGSAALWGRVGFFDAVKVRKPNGLLIRKYPSPWINDTRLPQVVHRPNLHAEVVHRESNQRLAAATTKDPPLVPLSIVSTMTNSFNELDEVMDLDLDAFLGLAASGGITYEIGGFKTPASNGLSSIAEYRPRPRGGEEIYWEGEPDPVEPQEPTKDDDARSSLRMAPAVSSLGASDTSKNLSFSESANAGTFPDKEITYVRRDVRYQVPKAEGMMRISPTAELGLEIAGAASSVSYPSIASVLPGSPLERDVAEGDAVLAVNGRSAVGLVDPRRVLALLWASLSVERGVTLTLGSSWRAHGSASRKDDGSEGSEQPVIPRYVDKDSQIDPDRDPSVNHPESLLEV